VYTSNNYDCYPRPRALSSPSPSLPLSRSVYTETRASTCGAVRVCARPRLNVPAVRFAPERISKRGGWSRRFLVRVRCHAVHAVVYEKVPRAIKFTGSVLHRVARVALSLSLSLSLSLFRARARALPLALFLYLFSLHTLDMAGWKRGRLDEFSKWRTMAFVVDIGRPLAHPSSYFVPVPARIHFPFP